MGWREIEANWLDLRDVIYDLLPGDETLEDVPASQDAIATRIARANDLTPSEVEEVLTFRALPRLRAQELPIAAE